MQLYESGEPIRWRKVNVMPESAMIHFDHGAHTRAEVKARSATATSAMTLARRGRHREHGVVHRLSSRARGVDRLRHLPSLRSEWSNVALSSNSALAAGLRCSKRAATTCSTWCSRSSA